MRITWEQIINSFADLSTMQNPKAYICEIEENKKTRYFLAVHGEVIEYSFEKKTKTLGAYNELEDVIEIISDTLNL